MRPDGIGFAERGVCDVCVNEVKLKVSCLDCEQFHSTVLLNETHV